MKISLELSYKGSRQYLHGTDFFNCIEALAGEVTGCDDAFVEQMSFRKITRTACELHTREPETGDAIVGTVRFKAPANGTTIDGWIVETGASVTGRYPFDEQAIVQKTALDREARTCTLSGGSIATPIEEIVILTKTLNYGVSPDIAGIWMFGRIDLVEKLKDQYEQLTIHMQRMVPGRFSTSAIIADGHELGSIQFIVGKA